MNVTVSGIDKAIKQVKAYRDSLEKKQKLLFERLAEIGIEVATLQFEYAVYDGDNDVVVEREPEWVSDTKLSITASGSTILFIEFGTGVHNPAYPVSAPYERGTYGQGKGKRRVWGYYGTKGQYGTGEEIETPRGTVVLTKGNPPARAMYDAGQEMRRHVLDIAKEVYGNG